MLIEDQISIIQKISSEYPLKLFTAGRIQVDLDDDNHTVYTVENLIKGICLKNIADISILNVVFDKKKENYLHGHFLRYYSGSKKFLYVKKRIDEKFSERNIFFSIDLYTMDFDQIIAISDNYKVILEGQRRDGNFYLTHFLKSTKYHNEMFDACVSSAGKRYVNSLNIPKNLDIKRKKAINRVLKCLLR